ncbi:MAG: family 16 glycosylhydrolase [Bacilli bacterium]|nr:family 16 glycosylhydrolase [Bacilli bacterium]
MTKNTIIKLFIFILLILAISLVGCSEVLPDDGGGGSGNNNSGNTPKEYVYREIEPDEFSDDTIAVLANGYKLIWTDEFNYTGSPDPAKWNYEVGGGGWGNNESQYYTNRDDNSYVSDGYLTITAKKESVSSYSYTSARLTSKNKGDFKYGYIEFRAILPEGLGTWPALWMMPTESVYGGWPNSGEIDIMETTGKNPSYIQGTTHTTVSQGGGVGGATTCPTSTKQWNTYACEWDDSGIKFMVNGKTYFTYTHSPNHDSTRWPFDQKFFLIMNIAMGGNMGGQIADDFKEAKMLVDYVRVYQKVDEADTVAPSAVEIKKYVSSYDNIYIEWDKATDNQGVRQYNIVVNNKQIGATMSNSYTIKNLEEATNYQVRIVSVDYNGNYTLSDIFTFATLKEPTLPGKIKGTDYSSATKKVSVVTASAEGGNCLQLPSGTEVNYRALCKTSGTYNVNLRVQVLKTCEVEIKILSDTETIYVNKVTLSSSYGKYNDVAFPELNLPAGEYQIKITCNASDTGNAIVINYLNIE